MAADYATQYLTPEDEYPVVQTTRTAGSLTDESLPYKLYDGQLFFSKKNIRLFIGTDYPVKTIADYPYFQAGDWKSITNSIAEKGDTGYKLRTDAVINALTDKNGVLNLTAPNKVLVTSDTVELSSDVLANGMLTAKGGLIVNKGLRVADGELRAGVIKAFDEILSYDTTSSLQYRLINNNTFSIDSIDDNATIQLGNKDMIKFADERVKIYEYLSNGYIKFMGGVGSNGYYNDQDYVLFNNTDTEFWKRISMGIFVTWTEYYDESTTFKDTPYGSYTHFIPKAVIERLVYQIDGGYPNEVTLTPDLIDIRYQASSGMRFTKGIPVTSGLMTSTYDLLNDSASSTSVPYFPGRPAQYLGVKTLIVTPVGLFGTTFNTSSQIPTPSGLTLNNKRWVLKYVTII